MKYNKFITEQGDNGYIDSAKNVRVIEVIAGLPKTVANDYNAYAFTFAVNAEGEIVESWGVEPVFADFNNPAELPYFLNIEIEGYNPDAEGDTVKLFFSDEYDRDDIADIIFDEHISFIKYEGR